MGQRVTCCYNRYGSLGEMLCREGTGTGFLEGTGTEFDGETNEPFVEESVTEEQADNSREQMQFVTQNPWHHQSKSRQAQPTQRQQHQPRQFQHQPHQVQERYASVPAPEQYILPQQHYQPQVHQQPHQVASLPPQPLPPQQVQQLQSPSTSTEASRQSLGTSWHSVGSAATGNGFSTPTYMPSAVVQTRGGSTRSAPGLSPARSHAHHVESHLVRHSSPVRSVYTKLGAGTDTPPRTSIDGGRSSISSDGSLHDGQARREKLFGAHTVQQSMYGDLELPDGNADVLAPEQPPRYIHPAPAARSVAVAAPALATASAALPQRWRCYNQAGHVVAEGDVAADELLALSEVRARALQGTGLSGEYYCTKLSLEPCGPNIKGYSRTIGDVAASCASDLKLYAIFEKTAVRWDTTAAQQQQNNRMGPQRAAMIPISEQSEEGDGSP
eukprot:TRINITY_DN10476_c0_g1_i10.p1 TRINITY_DN10476_c0_g1~~TRINITY_DN10476_c0_g1_i10.p1  ORF type:complete len:442 (-),score=50.65 TRINITY_DN10476_c0_g1_i10:451-1776(-)